jgi:transglutaminase-like putative cysteine protease
MAVLVNRTLIRASATNLATDLARYGSAASWNGVYYRGDKIGFTVNQTVAKGDGYEIEEDGRLQMALLGATTPATIRTRAEVDATFTLRSFEFSLDPGTGAVSVRGTVDGNRITLTIATPSGERTETRTLSEPPALSLNLSRRLANGGLKPGAHHTWMVFDPATLRNAPVSVDVGKREIVFAASKPVPAFRVQMEYSGLKTTSWMTDTGEVVREESPLGLITVRETPENARAMAVSSGVRGDLLSAAAVVPTAARRQRTRIDEPRDVRRLVLRLDGADTSSADMQGAGQTVEGNVVTLQDPQSLQAGPADREAAQYLNPEPLIESDAPEIRAEADIAIGSATTARDKAERITRHVNAILDKKPTVSLPSAREVLRTKIGDCNEHTALFVAMARSVGIPSRIAVGLVYIHGAFYYHAWPEVYIDEGKNRGLWLPVDPTLNEFPADATHVRLTRGGLEKQVVILPLIGKLKIAMLDLELAPNSTPILVGRQPTDLGPLAIPIPKKTSGGCWSAACCR